MKRIPREGELFYTSSFSSGLRLIEGRGGTYLANTVMSRSTLRMRFTVVSCQLRVNVCVCVCVCVHARV